MGELSRNWGEKEWEGYGNDLLSTHYGLLGGSYQRIPDTGGDCGLEGLSDSGNAYQCYADQNSKNNAERTRKQKKKICDDLKKLETYQQFWGTFMGTRKIRRWTLMVPYLDDKKVVQYGRAKGRALLAKGLHFIDPAFEVFVKTADDFPAAKLIAREPRLPAATAAPVTPAQLTAFKKKNPAFVQHLEDKLRKVLDKAKVADFEKFRDKLLTWHLECSNFLEDLHNDFPPQWEDIDDLINRKGNSISTEGFLDATPAPQRLNNIRREFAATLKEAQQYLREGERDLVSWGIVSRWLGECPLDFSES